MNILKGILIAAFLASPGAVVADQLADSIRANGAAALGSIQNELRASVVVAPAEPTYPLAEAIRQQGRDALIRITLETEMSVHVGNTLLAGRLQPMQRGTVTVSALQVVSPEVSESL